VYDDIEAPVTVLKYNRTSESGSPDELIKLLQLFDSVEKIAKYFQYYSSLTTFSLIILTLRLIKMLHFQPRISLLTRTLEEAAANLFHFFFLFTLVNAGYVLIGFLQFGRSVKHFSTIGKTADSCCRMILAGDMGPYDAILTSPNSAAGVVYCYSYIGIVFLILL
jgi:hypothetical protein